MSPEQAIKEAGQHYLPAIYRRVIMALTELPLTAEQVAEAIHCEKKAVQKALLRLRELKVVRVEEWSRATKPPSAVYGLGSRPDARRPAKLSSSEKCRRWRKSKEAQSGTVRIGVWGL